MDPAPGPSASPRTGHSQHQQRQQQQQQQQPTTASSAAAAYVDPYLPAAASAPYASQQQQHHHHHYGGTGYGGAGTYTPAATTANNSPAASTAYLPFAHAAEGDALRAKASRSPTHGGGAVRMAPTSSAYPPPPHSPQPPSSHSRSRTRPRRDSNDWAKLMSDAGYRVDATALYALDTPASATRPKGPLSWLRSVLRASLVLRWVLTILPVFAVLWIPGLLALFLYDARPHNDFAQPQVWQTGIFWWSVWLSGVWLGWWLCRAAAGLGPRLLRKVVVNLAAVAEQLGIQRMIDYIVACDTYLAVFLQTVLVYALWLEVIWRHFDSPGKAAAEGAGGVDPLNTTGTTNSSTTGTSSIYTNLAAAYSTSGSASSSSSSSDDSTTELFVTISRFFFGLMLCSALLLAEKLFIQAIAYSFHQATYADRLAASRFQVACLATLYSHSTTQRDDNVLLATGTETTAGAKKPRRGSFNALSLATTKGVKSARERFRGRSTRDTRRQPGTILGAMALEIRDQKGLLQATNPKFIVLSALESEKETRRLARRLFYAFAHRSVDGVDGVQGAAAARVISVQDIRGCFPDLATASAAFALFDQDGNDSMTCAELEWSCEVIRSERLNLVHSMHDVDSAVDSLDSMFMSVYLLIAAVICAAMLSTKFSELVTSLGSVLLGLSWLFSSSAAESFAAIIFLIGKHPYDSGDRVDVIVPGSSAVDTYEVAQLGLLSTIFRDAEGKYVQIANAQLSQRTIVNHRRSGPIEEPLLLDIAYGTDLRALEALRERMLAWIAARGRDFLPGLNLRIESLGPDQSKMQIAVGIRYKSNWQDPLLRAQRRNRWVCALRGYMRELRVYGPRGDPDAKDVTRVAMVADAEDDAAAGRGGRGAGAQRRHRGGSDGGGGGGDSGKNPDGAASGDSSAPAQTSRASSPPPPEYDPALLDASARMPEGYGGAVSSGAGLFRGGGGVGSGSGFSGYASPSGGEYDSDAPPGAGAGARRRAQGGRGVGGRPSYETLNMDTHMDVGVGRGARAPPPPSLSLPVTGLALEMDRLGSGSGSGSGAGAGAGAGGRGK